MRHAATAVCWLSTVAIFRQPSILRNPICPLATRLKSRTSAASSLGSEPCVLTRISASACFGAFRSSVRTSIRSKRMAKEFTSGLQSRREARRRGGRSAYAPVHHLPRSAPGRHFLAVLQASLGPEDELEIIMDRRHGGSSG